MNFCTNLLFMTKNEYFCKLEIIKVNGCKKVWKTIKLLFSWQRSVSCNKVILSKNDPMILDEIILSAMNIHSVTITAKLKIKPTETVTKKLSLWEILDRYKDQPKHCQHWLSNEWQKEFNRIQNCHVYRSTKNYSFFVKAEIRRSLADPFYHAWQELSVIPNHLFLPWWTKIDRHYVSFWERWPFWQNYRLVSVLSHQPNQWLHTTLFSDLVTCFCRNHGTQHCLIKMLEKQIHLLDNGYHWSAFMGLSKAFDEQNHSLLLAKLSAYGLSLKSTTFTIQS